MLTHCRGARRYRGLAQFDGPVPVQASTVCQVWGPGRRAGVYPMANNEVYWFATFDAAESLPQKNPEELKADAMRLVDGWSHGVAECIAHTPADGISCNRFLDRWPSPIGGLTDASATLLGDAFHPVTPDLGQVR